MKKSKKRKGPLPFEFIFEAIKSLSPHTQPMFGCTAVYVKAKLIFILRDRSTHTCDNGVWLIANEEHYESLKKDFPIMRPLTMKGPSSTSWQNLPSSSIGFKKFVLKACALVLAKDRRIGKIPGAKRRIYNSGD